MKKFTLLALLACATSWHAASAQTSITIAAARAQQPTTNATAGATVTVRGIATNGNELGAIRYFQDGTAGIAAYGGSAGTTPAVAAVLNSVQPGDSILVTGQLKQFYGFLEIDPLTSVTILAGNRPVVPVSFPAGSITPAFAEQYEGQLVRINGISSINTSTGAPVTAFASVSAGYRINNNAATPLYINAASTGPYGLIGKPAPTGLYDAIGLISQHMTANTGVVNTTTGYQLLPRLYADFIQGLTPNVIGTPTTSNISTTGFTVNFLTQNAGNTQLSYGTSPTGPFTSVTDAASVTTHALALTGLQPATVYYVQAISVNSVGQSQSRVVPMITQSLSSGKMRVYFNNPVDNTLALPGNNAVYLPSGHIADTLASYINKARKTVDLAIYNWNSTVILNSVNAARARGVKVRVIYEDDNANVSINSLNAAIPRVGRPAQAGSSGSAIMHNKFVVIDADTNVASTPWVWTGSTNWTSAQLTTDRNSAIAIQDQALARVYTIEFNEMWGSTTLTPGTLLFGNRKTDNTPHYLRIGNRDVQSYFSPTDNVNGRLIETVQTADNDLHFASMLITRADIARAIRDRVQLRGIAACTEGVTNDTSATDGSGNNFRIIRSAIGTRMIKKVGSYIFHHKYLIVDAGASQSDPTIFLGSHNWTNSADNENDENTLVIHDAKIVNQYYQEFSTRVSEQNIAGVAVCRLVLATKNGSIQASTLQVYPNPTSGSFQLHLASTSARTATIVLRDVTGRVVLTQTQPLTGTDLNIDATSLKSGLYMVQVTTPEAVQTSRVVVE
ncbi:phospholipase D-like domain-containing protein [Hymenobacter negativus]|uniref:phospholipase D n=1 Tax=Hymenobacter negativus TaxID=2795026 RepID=A0ABS0Q5K0_9BACT|nr:MULTISPECIES: phospholipase D-like domain-containing protein [Bacteria]MBH8557939.1 T9SS type A sorting domain-containing protein [Hymenobacter negativus]MBH8567518.1 T9SS type A sorting domain-containing protein [Hymenobacter negativus]MBR7207250.1 T9SS type A sorting domain-containing protein [Microvirga sp. STS02]